MIGADGERRAVAVGFDGLLKRAAGIDHLVHDGDIGTVIQMLRLERVRNGIVEPHVERLEIVVAGFLDVREAGLDDVLRRELALVHQIGKFREVVDDARNEDAGVTDRAEGGIMIHSERLVLGLGDRQERVHGGKEDASPLRRHVEDRAEHGFVAAASAEPYHRVVLETERRLTGLVQVKVRVGGDVLKDQRLKALDVLLVAVERGRGVELGGRVGVLQLPFIRLAVRAHVVEPGLEGVEELQPGLEILGIFKETPAVEREPVGLGAERRDFAHRLHLRAGRVLALQVKPGGAGDLRQLGLGEAHAERRRLDLG